MANSAYYGPRPSRPSYGYDDHQQQQPPSSASTYSSFPSSPSSPPARHPGNSVAPAPPAYQPTPRGRSHSSAAADERGRGPRPQSPGPSRKGALIAAVTGATLATVADKYFVQDMINGRHKKKPKPDETPEELFRRIADVTIGGYLGLEAYNHARSGTFGGKLRNFDPADHIPGGTGGGVSGGGGGGHRGKGGSGGSRDRYYDDPDYEVEEYSDDDGYYDRGHHHGSRRRRANSYGPAASGSGGGGANGRSHGRRKSKSTLLSIMDGLNV